MKIKSIYISQGLFYTERFFETGFNLIFSEKNSAGKTTLMRCILYGLGYAVPGTKKFNIENCSVRLVFEKDDGKLVTLNRNTSDSIELTESDTQYSYALPMQAKELHEKIYGTDNEDILNNLLGAIYADQEKGWTLLNRGKAIAGIHFNIDELIRGLSGRNCSDILLHKKKVEENIKKYKQILNIAEYRESIASDSGSLARDSYNRERLLMQDQLKVERDEIKKEIKRLDENIRNNKKTIELIDDMKLVIRLETGQEICVTRDMIIGATDSIDFLQAKKRLLIPRLERILKEIEKIELEIREEEQQLLLFPTESLADVFDRKMTEVDISPIDVKRVIGDLEKERSALNNQISQITNDGNDITQSMIKTVQKYMGELGDTDAEKMTWKYLFTSNLKELSGAVLHKTVFSFRLAYILEIEKALGTNYKVQGELDSLKQGLIECKDENSAQNEIEQLKKELDS